MCKQTLKVHTMSYGCVCHTGKSCGCNSYSLTDYTIALALKTKTTPKLV